MCEEPLNFMLHTTSVTFLAAIPRFYLIFILKLISYPFYMNLTIYKEPVALLKNIL